MSTVGPDTSPLIAKYGHSYFAETVVAGEREVTDGALARGRDRDRTERALLGLQLKAQVCQKADLSMRSIIETRRARSRCRHL